MGKVKDFIEEEREMYFNVLLHQNAISQIL